MGGLIQAPQIIITGSGTHGSDFPFLLTQKDVPNTPPQSGGEDAANNPAACACTAASHHQEAAGPGDESAAKRPKTSAT